MNQVIAATLLVVASLAGGGLSTPAAARDLDPASAKTLHDYPVTLDKVKAYEKGFLALMAAAQADPAVDDDFRATAAEPTKSIADEVAKMDHHPGTYGYFAKEGLSKEDVAILPLALMGGCMLAQYPTAAAKLPQVSDQQAAFCKANRAMLESMRFFGAK